MSDTAEETWEAAIDAGEKSFHAADYREAETQFRKAFDVAHQWEPQDIRCLWSYDYLMLVYRTQGKDAEAEALRERALEISKQLEERAEEMRQNATTGADMDTALCLKGSSVFYRRRGRWTGRGAAESFADAYGKLDLKIRSRSVSIGDHEATAAGDMSSSGGDGHAIVQSGPDWVLLCLMAKYGDETQLSLRAEECGELIEALQNAMAHAWE